jgi:hydrogenase maturation protease
VSSDGVLVVGYGNALRGDDGVGLRVADLLQGDQRLAGARVERRHQLTPELAEDVAAARLVVLVDAADGGAVPGDVRVERVAGERWARAFTGSHAVDAGAVVDLAERLYGRAAPVVLVSVVGRDFGPGTDLSPAVLASLSRAVDTVVGVVDGRTSADTA